MEETKKKKRNAAFICFGFHKKKNYIQNKRYSLIDPLIIKKITSLQFQSHSTQQRPCTPQTISTNRSTCKNIYHKSKWVKRELKNKKLEQTYKENKRGKKNSMKIY